MKKEYNSNSIDFLEGLNCVRKRPDMYIGQTSGNPSGGLFRLLRETLDNSLDEYLGGYNNKIYIFYNSETNETTIIDNGRGIPVGYNEKAKQDALTLVFTQLHAGGKFNNSDVEAYKTSSGKNGVGIKALNALSEKLQVWSNNSDNGKWNTQTFEKGIVKSKVKETTLPKEYKKLIKNKGTILTWTPDKEIFVDSIRLDVNRLKKELHDIQYLCPNLEIHLVVDGKDTLYYSEKGLEELVARKKENNIFKYSSEFIDVALNFTKEDNDNFKSFVNICYTNQGGTHLKGLKKCITDTIKGFSKQKIMNDDILEGIIGTIHYRMAEPQYQGQTKNELTNSEVERDVIEHLSAPLTKWLKKNKSILERIVKHAENMLQIKNKLKESKDLSKGLKTLNNSSRFISDKFLDADRRKYKNVKDLEMFIVEGDSAGGHFKQAREGFQGQLKIRGKIINAAKASVTALFGKTTKKGEKKAEGNREIKDLVASLGCGILDNYNEKKLRFDKVVILCFDGDTKVKLLNGNSISFKDLVDYEKENPDTEYWVYSKDKFGNTVPGKAKHPRITGYKSEMIELTFDNNKTIKCTPEQLFMLHDGTYKEAKDLSLDDSLMALYTKKNDCESYNNNRELIYDNGKWEFTHKIVSNYFNGETIPGQQIHHIDENYLNNEPNNLIIMNSNEHRKLHNSKAGQRNKHLLVDYNKSDKHKQRVSDLWKNTNTYDNATWKTTYNDSVESKEFHSNLITNLNKDENVKLTRNKNKLINIGMLLIMKGIYVNENTFVDNKELVRNTIGSCPTNEYVIECFGEFNCYIDELNNKLNNIALDALLELQNKNVYVNEIKDKRCNSNIKTKKNGMAKIAKVIFDRKLEFNSENYMEIRKELGSIRMPKFENYINYFESFEDFKEYSKNYNHKVIAKKIIKYDEPIPVYDLTVDEFHNFVVDLEDGSGVQVKNCDADVDGQHINNLCLSFFIMYMPDLIKNGHLYIVDAPLFIASSSKEKVYGMTRTEVEKKMKELKVKDYIITRLKGWGECSADQLSELCLNPKTRKLIQIKWTENTEEMLIKTMGDDVPYRKKMLGVIEE